MTRTIKNIDISQLPKERILKPKLAKGEYTLVATKMLKNMELSWEAKGLLAFLKSFPTNFNHSFANILKYSKCGERALQTILKELETYKLLVRQKINVASQRSQRGNPKEIQTIWVVSETSIDSDTFLNSAPSCSAAVPIAAVPIAAVPIAAVPNAAVNIIGSLQLPGPGAGPPDSKLPGPDPKEDIQKTVYIEQPPFEKIEENDKAADAVALARIKQRASEVKPKSPSKPRGSKLAKVGSVDSVGIFKFTPEQKSVLAKMFDWSDYQAIGKIFKNDVHKLILWGEKRKKWKDKFDKPIHAADFFESPESREFFKEYVESQIS